MRFPARFREPCLVCGSGPDRRAISAALANALVMGPAANRLT
jgi:hypothetical protein